MLHSGSLRFKGKMPARTAKLAKRMELALKPYQFDDFNPVMALSLLGQFKRAFDFNRVSHGAYMWLLLSIAAKSPAASLTIRLTVRKDVNVDSLAILHCRIEGYKRICMYVGEVNYLPKAYASNDVIAKAASEIKSFKKLPNQMAVQFSQALNDKPLRGGDVFSKQRIKSTFVKGLHLNGPDYMHIYREAISTMHLRQLEEYANTLVPWNGNKPSSSTKSQLSLSRRVRQIVRPCDRV